MKRDPVNAEAVTQSYLSGLEGDSQFWPNDNGFRTALETGELYRTLSRARLRIVLEALETASETKYAETLLVLDKLTIEHLLPQAWAAHWPLPADKYPAEAEKERDRRIHRLGNLTLVTERLNPKLSNGPWASKRADTLEHSALAINRTLPEDWSEESIDSRGRALADVAVSIWEGPSDGALRDIGAAAEEPEEEPLRTEPLTPEDLLLGRLRIPVEAALLFPEEDGEVTLILRGTQTSGSWQAALAGDGDGLGFLTVDPSLLARLTEEDDSLVISGGTADGVFVD